MIRKDKIKLKDGVIKTYIRVTEGYRPIGGAKPKQRTVKSFGYLEDQEDQAAFLKEVENFNRSLSRVERIVETMDLEAMMYSSEGRKYNYGYKYIESVYNLLKIDEFIDVFTKAKKFKLEYPIKDIFKYLVIQRIMNPGSKRHTAQLLNQFYDFEADITLQHIYRSLDVIHLSEQDIQKHIGGQIDTIVKRDSSYAYYDLTNYYCEVDLPDEEDGGLRKRGVSKEHRVDPIVEMALVMDSNGIPLRMSIFPGNHSESTTVIPTMKDIKKDYQLDKLIFVADKGLNTSSNIDYMINNGDGYVLSQILKGKKGKRYHEELFDENGWIIKSDKYKYKLIDEVYDVKDENNNTVKKKRKVLFYWNKDQADLEAHKREDKVERAKKRLTNNVYSIDHGIGGLLKETVCNKEDGEIIEKTKKIYSIDHEKVDEDAKFDGYSCIITSELDYTAEDIRRVYSGLWKIEQSFRITKSDLDARPIYCSTGEHIRAHFIICYVALVVLRLIEKKMSTDSITVERIQNVLNACTCSVSKNGIIQFDDVGGEIAFKKRKDKHGNLMDTLMFDDKDEISEDFKIVQKYFGTNFEKRYMKQEIFKTELNKISLA